MTTETILTDEQIDQIAISSHIMHESRDHDIQFARAIEQAVLQSDQVQAWKRDAERYRYLSGRDDASATGVGCWLERNGEALECGWLYGDQLDATIDAAMEGKE